MMAAADRPRRRRRSSTGRWPADIKAAFNAHFYNTTLRRYTTDGNAGTDRRDPDRAGAGARRRARPGHRTGGRPRRPRRARLRLPPDPATARTSAAGPSAWPRPSGRWPPAAATTCSGICCSEDEQPSYGFFMAADHRQPQRHDHHGRALEPRRLQEPHDPRPDRGVVPHRPGRHPRRPAAPPPTGSWSSSPRSSAT